MLTAIHPKLPMRNLSATRNYYVQQLGFEEVADYGNYFIVRKDNIEIHFFLHEHLDTKTNDGQVYIRTNAIDDLYADMRSKTTIHPNGALQTHSWGMREFSLLDPDHNLLTFGQPV